MPQRIVEKKTVSIAEAKNLLEKVEEPNQFQLRTIEYARKFSKVEGGKAQELTDRLMQEFEIERSDAIAVINCMPTSIEELRAFFYSGRKRLILTSQLEGMLKILDGYR
jgi:DNA-directed RNA polymerase subunit F